MTDPVARSDELDRRFLAIPEDKVFTKRTVVAGYLTLALPMLALGAATYRAVNGEIAGLQDRNAELETTVDQQNEVIGQAVDAIQLQNQMLRDAGVEPPEIVLRPTDPPDEGDD